jgi:helicase
MFGRAGRVGAGEEQGWSFLIVEPHERAEWQSNLAAGYTVRSQIQSSLPEQVLSEVVQERVHTERQAGQWWVRTLAFHQGRHDLRPLQRAVTFLAGAGMLSRTPDQPGDQQLTATDLGKLTARLMVSPPVCDNLRQTIEQAPFPCDPAAAEETLIAALADTVPKLTQANIGDDGRAAVARLLCAGRNPDLGGSGDLAYLGARPGDLARAALLAVSTDPTAFRPGIRQVGGVPYAAMYPILEEAPRYLHWLACQGLFGTIHPWCAIVAADLGRRVRWRNLQPPLGSGRLLWMCEQMSTTEHLDDVVPQLWSAARAHGHRSPDWTALGRPAHCRLDRVAYATLLRERATDAVIDTRHQHIRAKGPVGSVLAVWGDAQYRTVPIRQGVATAERPADASATMDGAAVFTWRGDYLATGWLAAYAQLAT